MLRIDVFCYEYRGYYNNKFRTTDMTILKDALHSYDYLINNLKYKPS